MAYENAVKLLRLAVRAAGRVGVTLTEIEEMFECNRRTAQRMTDALTEVFPETDRWVDEEQRPRWRLPPTSVTAFVTPTPEELALLSKAIEKLAVDGAPNEARTLKGLEEKVLANIPNNKRARLEVDEEAMLQALGLAARPGPRALSDGAIDDALSTALKGRRCIEILYSSRSDPKPRWRSVAPHGLLLGTRRYLVARDLKKSSEVLQHYRIEDIAEVRILSECFEPNQGFDLAVHARGGFGSFINHREIERIVWCFAPDAAERAKRFVFHPDQEVTDNADGSLTVSFSACGQLEMCWHLYSWGDKVEVLEPASLRDMVDRYRRSDFAALP
ncbi:helix-turn-helix transcriptional regulator [Sphingobium tyrosinilyticum]|uniref:Helix-turn-helix transcriptional regulator n=1 Tax=Sphingobium tyrosinilyticum TaxID=2715436 RepID=A0ABV9F2P5_9SPHN